MSDEARTVTEVEEERKEPAAPQRSQVGASFVGPIGIVLTMTYLILFSILLLYGLVQLWPSSVSAGESAPTTSPVTFLCWTFCISDEVRLLLIVALAGALGGLDALLSTVQMPTGIPVATVAVDGAANAGYLAIAVLATGDEELAAALDGYRESLHG